MESKAIATAPKLARADMVLTPEAARHRKSASPGPLEQLFFEHHGRPVNKWLHYLPFYDEVFRNLQGKPIRILEIGVQYGGSLELWRKYFGPEAVIYGIDINPKCGEGVTPPTQFRAGSQDDPSFLQAVVAEMGGVDVIIDDGSHVAQHQTASFRSLWPLLNVEGIYVIEDLHSSYWPDFEGGLRRPGTAIELVKQLIDDMHAWYHTEHEALASGLELGSIRVTDSIAAITKVAPRLSPGNVYAGRL
jgi:cephalosporin hydroxylase